MHSHIRGSATKVDIGATFAGQDVGTWRGTITSAVIATQSTGYHGGCGVVMRRHIGCANRHRFRAATLTPGELHASMFQFSSSLKGPSRRSICSWTFGVLREIGWTQARDTWRLVLAPNICGKQATNENENQLTPLQLLLSNTKLSTHIISLHQGIVV